MPRGYRYVIPAFAGIAIAFCIVMFTYDLGRRGGLHEGEANRYTGAEQRNIQSRIRERCADIVGSAWKKCAAETVDTARERQRNERDLQSQRDAARWAFWATIVAALQVPVGIGGLLALLRSLGQTDRALAEAESSNVIARQTSQLENRPILVLESVKLERGAGVNNMYATPVWRNIGKLPAFPVLNYTQRIYQKGTHPWEEISPILRNDGKNSPPDSSIIPSGSAYAGGTKIITSYEIGALDRFEGLSEQQIAAMLQHPGSQRFFSEKMAVVLFYISYICPIGEFNTEWRTEEVYAIVPVWDQEGAMITDQAMMAIIPNRPAVNMT